MVLQAWTTLCAMLRAGILPPSSAECWGLTAPPVVGMRMGWSAAEGAGWVHTGLDTGPGAQTPSQAVFLHFPDPCRVPLPGPVRVTAA